MRRRAHHPAARSRPHPVGEVVGAEVERSQERAVHHVPQGDHVPAAGIQFPVRKHVHGRRNRALNRLLQAAGRILVGFPRRRRYADPLPQIRLVNRR